MAKSHIYPGANSLNTYINIKGCSAAIEFYKKAFGATEKLRLLMPDGKVAHAELEIEGSLLMMADENPDWGTKSPETLGGNPVTMGLYVPDVDQTFQKESNRCRSYRNYARERRILWRPNRTSHRPIWL